VAQGERSSGEQATELLAQAVEAYRAALEVRTKTDLPQGWATTQVNLGNALTDQGERSSSARATELLAQAVQAYRAALEVFTKADLPQTWAVTQTNLGVALVDQGERSSGEQTTELLAQAVQAYRAALEVRTKADLPQDWAMTQNDLGLALVDLGGRSSGTQATELLAQAVQAYRAALEVQTKTDLPQDWAMTQNNLGLALTAQGEQSSGAQSTEFLAQAVQAFRAALEVYTKADSPQNWAKAQFSLGSALLVQRDYSAAADAIEAALEVFPTNNQFLQVAEGLYHEYLYRYDRALELAERMVKIDSSPESRLGFMEANLTASRFEACAQQAALIDNASLSQPGVLVRDTLKLTCDWGAGQKSAARQTEQALVSEAAGLQKTGWNSAGTLHFLASSPVFESGRASWIVLFESLESGDGAAMAGALHQLEEVMSH
jgi:tetratricopeptide (TPR) repeat protein